MRFTKFLKAGVAALGLALVASSLSAVSPANALGQKSYTFADAPIVKSVSPNGGPIAGGTTISLLMTWMGDVSTLPTIKIGSAPCTSVAKTSGLTLECVTGAATAGTKDVVVTTYTGLVSNAVSYTYYAVPVPVNATPNGGSTLGGTAISVSGNNLSGATSVTIGGNECTSLVVVDSNNLTCTTPAGTAGTQDIYVTTPGGRVKAISGFIYQAPAPTTTAITPLSGSADGGTAVTITGTNFVSGTSVSFGETPCTNVVVVSATSITCTTPAHAEGASYVRVAGTNGMASNLQFTFLASGPTVSAVSPNNGPVAGGTSITVTGTKFGSDSTVTVGGKACGTVSVASATSLTCTTPAGTVGAAEVAVTSASKIGKLASAFTYTASKPTVTSINPPGIFMQGVDVTISGTGFIGTSAVTVSGITCKRITVVDDSTLKCSLEYLDVVGHSGTMVATVVSNGLTSDPGGSITILSGKPVVTAISPAKIPTIGGSKVTFTGTNLQQGVEIKIDGKLCTDVKATGTTKLTCTAPATSTGAKTVTFKDIWNGMTTLSKKATYGKATAYSARFAIYGDSPWDLALVIANSLKTYSSKFSSSPYVNVAVKGYATTKAIFDANIATKLSPDMYKDLLTIGLTNLGATVGTYSVDTKFNSSTSLPSYAPDAKTKGWATATFTYYGFN